MRQINKSLYINMSILYIFVFIYIEIDYFIADTASNTENLYLQMIFILELSCHIFLFYIKH